MGRCSPVNHPTKILAKQPEQAIPVFFISHYAPIPTAPTQSEAMGFGLPGGYFSRAMRRETASRRSSPFPSRTSTDQPTPLLL